MQPKDLLSYTGAIFATKVMSPLWRFIHLHYECRSAILRKHYKTVTIARKSMYLRVIKSESFVSRIMNNYTPQTNVIQTQLISSAEQRNAPRQRVKSDREGGGGGEEELCRYPVSL